MKTTRAKKYFVKELKDADTSKEYDASKPLIAGSKRKKSKIKAAK